MELIFNNWKIKKNQENIRQYDDNVWTIKLTGDLPEGWKWKVLLSQNDNIDVIDLEQTDNGMEVTMTADMLSVSGYCSVQIKGISGDMVRHTNIVEMFIGKSLSGDAAWPEIPTAFSQAEKRIDEKAKAAVDAAETATEKAQKVEEAVVHSPVISDAGTWLVWDFAKGAYVDTGVAASGGGVSEKAVFYTEQELTDEQKAQARKNIGATDGSGVGAHTTSWLLENYPDKVKLDESTSTLTIYIGSTDEKNIPFGNYILDKRCDYFVFKTISDDGSTSKNIVRFDLNRQWDSSFCFSNKAEISSLNTPMYSLTLAGGNNCLFTVGTDGALNIIGTSAFATTSNVLTKTNKSDYTPTADYHPATKKYVDDSIPTNLPSPHSLTFTGAVTGSYDGSQDVSVEIPQGGGGETWELINEITLTETVNNVVVDRDASGQPFELRKAKVECVIQSDESDPFTNIKILCNGVIVSSNATTSVKTGVKYYSGLYVWMGEAGIMAVPLAGVFNNNYNWNYTVQKMGFRNKNDWKQSGINSLTVSPNDGGKPLGIAGTKIFVFGVRA